MPELVRLLVAAGLIQFGRFGRDGKPYQLHLGLLPSYPDVLRLVAIQAAPLVGEVDRLLCVGTSLPFGISLSLETKIPLVYSRGSQADAVYDLAGAYDIGHPTLLVADTSEELVECQRLAEQARQVGLEVNRILLIIDAGGYQQTDLKVASLMKLTVIVEALVESGDLAEGQARTVQDWLASHS